MRISDSISRILKVLFRRGRFDAELDEELAFHLQMETRKNLQKGMSPPEARRRALIAFGGMDRFVEQTREERAWRPAEEFLSDLRFAFRTMGKNPGFTAVAVLSLALGIGVNTAVFGLVDAMLLRPPFFEAPEQLVNLYRDRAQGSFDPMSYPDYLVLQEGSRGVFEDLGGFQYARVQRQGGDGLETLTAEMVTGNYMSLLGVRASRGRILLPEDHQAPGAHPVVVLAYPYWERAFQGDPQVVGRSILLNGRSYTVVGVAPEAFTGSTRGVGVDLFAPIMMVGNLVPLEDDLLASRGSNAFFPVGRIREGVSWPQMEAVLATLSSDLHRGAPEVWQSGEGVVAVPTEGIVFSPSADGAVTSGNLLALTLTGLVLLIACTNLASFLLARALDRRREMALRMALGAPRWRLVRQLLTEAVAMGVLGGAGGFLMALWFLSALGGAPLPSGLPLGLDLSPDWRVPVFALVAALGAGVLIGVLPAAQASRPGLALKDLAEPREGRGAHFLGRALVAGQMAVSVVLLVAAGLFVRSYGATRQVNPGFGRGPTAVLSIMIPSRAYSEEEGRQLLTSLEDEIRRLPSVEGVGAISNIHLNTVNRMILEVNVDGVPPPEGRSANQVDFTSVDNGFFSAAGIPVLEGRAFDGTDGAGGRRVVVINEALARRFWPGGSAVGSTIRVEVPGWPDVTVVGVVATAKIRSLAEPATPFIYFPYAQAYNAWVSILAVSRGDPEATTRDLYRLVRERHPDLVVTGATTLARHIGIMLVLRRFAALLCGMLAVMALGLAVVGLYGIVSHSVAMRTREMGIRLSLGASPAAVVAQQLRRGMTLVVVGGALGLLGAAFAARAAGGFLYGVSAWDPPTFLGVAVVLGGVSLAAAYWPARRASRVDPVITLKAQ